jgi:uncharacterized protein (DUF2235 family)
MNATNEQTSVWKEEPIKRLALFFDGTWNEPGDNTNVWRLYLMLADQGADGMRQVKYYNQGVGTHWYDELTGGAFGVGLQENVRAGYRWLMENYNEGDEVFLFGFSRGAFTARGLVGLVARCGLLKPDAPMSFIQLFERYQRGDSATPIYDLKYFKKKPDSELDFEERVLVHHAWYHPQMIKMVGVWDTVGSIGVPFGNIPGVSRRTLRFINTNLSTVAAHSYQALALDEQRQPYWAMLWTAFELNSPDETATVRAQKCFIEQRWFAGAHANLGGGYRSDLLPNRPLKWLYDKAAACGLGFRCTFEINDEDFGMKPVDSYTQFLDGFWKIMTLGKRYIRWVQAEPKNKKKGRVRTVNERIDWSVFERWQKDSAYRPASLLEWSKRKKLDVAAIIANPELFRGLWEPVTKPGVE